MNKKTLVITGGNGAIAKALAMRMVLHCSEYKEEWNLLLPSRHDLPVENEAMVDSFMAANSPDILINCAGFIHPQDTETSISRLWVHEGAVNYLGTYFCTKYALANGAKVVVNVASSAGTNPKPGWSGYCASKAAVIMFTKCLALEGQQVVCVSPGRTDTPMRNTLFPNEDKTTLMHPDDVAEVIYLAMMGNFSWGSNVQVSRAGASDTINITVDELK